MFLEGQFDIGKDAVIDALALQFDAAGLIPGRVGLSIEGEGDGIEDRRLAGTGFAGDQKQVLIDFGKVDFGSGAIGFKRLHHKLERLH